MRVRSNPSLFSSSSSPEIKKKNRGEERSEKAHDIKDDESAFISSFHRRYFSRWFSSFPRRTKKKTTRDVQREDVSLSLPRSSLKKKILVFASVASI
jgi:hypothetical protein